MSTQSLLRLPTTKEAKTISTTTITTTTTRKAEDDDTVDTGITNSHIIAPSAELTGRQDTLHVAAGYTDNQQIHKKHSLLMNTPDAVLLNIFQFIGPGHYIFVALVSHRLKALYEEYYTKLHEDEIPLVQYRRFGLDTKATTTNTLYSAASSSVSCAKFWDEDTNGQNGRLCNHYDVCETVVANKGNLEVLKWARANDYEWDSTTCTEAASGGHLEILKWARTNGCPWDETTCSSAAFGGYLDVLQWARENGCPWNRDTCSWAAENGHMEVLKWARANGCPWDTWTTAFAAKGGHLKVLQWARENGCPWDKFTLEEAIQWGHEETEAWARLNGCPEPDPESDSDSLSSWDLDSEDSPSLDSSSSGDLDSDSSSWDSSLWDS